jgi:hypothetical protein
VLPAGCANKIQNEYGMSFLETWNGWFIYTVLHYQYDTFKPFLV